MVQQIEHCFSRTMVQFLDPHGRSQPSVTLAPWESRTTLFLSSEDTERTCCTETHEAKTKHTLKKKKRNLRAQQTNKN